MKKKKYEKPTCIALLLTEQMQLLADSGSSTDPEPTQPNENVPEYDDWLQ